MFLRLDVSLSQAGASTMGSGATAGPPGRYVLPVTVALYLRSARRHAALVAVLAVLGGLLAGAGARLAPPRYTAHVRLATAFGPPTPGALSSSDSSSAVVAAALHTNRRLIESRVRSYALLAGSPQVLAPIAAAMRLPYSADTLADHVAASVPLDSTLIDIEVTDSDPIRAGTALQAIVASLTAIADGEPHTANPASVLRISVRDPVSLPFRPAPDRWPLYLLAGFAAGLAVGVGLATGRVLLAERNETMRGWSAARWAQARDGLRAAGRRAWARS